MSEKIELEDYISTERLQQLQDSFASVVGMGAAISDANGSAITQAVGMCEFCKYTRVSRIGSERCRKCDSEGSEKAFVEGKPVSYTCHAGLTDFVAPIVIENQRVGCFVGGQVRLGELDEEKVRQTAADIGVNPEMYLALAKRTPSISQESLENAMEFINNVTLSISDMAEKQYQIEKAKDEIEYAAKLKSDFLANMSHEIRTPMNGVIGIAELALMDEIPKQTEKYLKQIRTSGKTLLTITNDIFDYSKIESGTMDILESSYSPKVVIEEVLEMISEKAAEKGLKLSYFLANDVPKRLIGDSNRIKQVLYNLVNNAVKFTETGYVKVDIISTEIKPGVISLQFAVIDTGIGIAPENIKKLFQSFQQVDSSRSRQTEGTGLGLAIAKSLVELMHGKIGVKSTIGTGSTFAFALPQKIDSSADEQQEMSDDKSFVFPGARVLIVDDNEVNLTVAAGLMAPLKMEIDTALSGMLAVEMATAKDYDFIFMDHMMPEMDGIETTHAIMELPGYENVPIVALTANVMEGSREMFLREGLKDYVTKPVDFKAIVAVLHRWMPLDKQVVSEKPLEAVNSDSSLEIQGLDTKAALKMLGTEALYMNVLKDYYRVIGSKAKAIQEMYDAEDWENYTIAVHALKSSSRQIGAMELGELAASMEKAGNEKDIEAIRANTESLLAQYRAYEPILKPLFERNEDKIARIPLDPIVLEGYFKDLEAAMDDLDMDKMNEVVGKIILFEFNDDCQEIVNNLEESVNMVDVDAAAELINEIRELIQ